MPRDEGSPCRQGHTRTLRTRLKPSARRWIRHIMSYQNSNTAPEYPGLVRIRRWSHLLDSAFRIPGTRLRFGWDPVIGLVPVLGDVITALFSLIILVHAFRIRVPGVVRARMFLNVLIDLAVGAIPIIGDLFDFAWKSNARNLGLLERHAAGYSQPTAGDWAFVLGSLAVVAAVVTLPILAIVALLQHIPSGWLPSPPAWKIL